MTDGGRKISGVQQLRIPLSYAPAHGREDFIVSSSNADTVSLVDRWPYWPSPALALAGAPGTGKSHLAAAWAGATGAVVVQADNLGNCDLASLVHDRPILVEDADRKLDSENALFHLLNLVREYDVGLLLTCRELPTMWKVDLADLRSRLRAIPVAGLEQPDEPLLAAVLVKLFADRQILVERTVIDYLVMRMERSMEAAHRLVAALDDEALKQGRGVTKGVARRVLETLFG